MGGTTGIVQGAGYIEKELLKIEALCKSDCEPVDKSKSLDEPHRTSDNCEIFSSTYVEPTWKSASPWFRSICRPESDRRCANLARPKSFLPARGGVTYLLNQGMIGVADYWDSDRSVSASRNLL